MIIKCYAKNLPSAAKKKARVVRGEGEGKKRQKKREDNAYKSLTKIYSSKEAKPQRRKRDTWSGTAGNITRQTVAQWCK